MKLQRCGNCYGCSGELLSVSYDVLAHVVLGYFIYLFFFIRTTTDTPPTTTTTTTMTTATTTTTTTVVVAVADMIG